MTKTLLNSLPTSTLTRKLLVGFATSLSYAIYPALIALFTLDNFGISLREKIVIGFTLVTIKEIFTLLIYFFISSPRSFFRDVKKTFTKAGWIVAFGGLFGGPIGYSMETISALYIGGSLAALLSSMSIFFIFLFEVGFLKRKHTKVNILGIFITSAGIITISLLTANKWEWNAKIFLGISFAILASLSWTAEALFMDVGMHLKDNILTPKSSLRIRQLFSTIFLVTIIWPLVFTSLRQTHYAIGFMNDFFHNWENILEMVFVGSFLISARFFFLKAINMQGSTMGFVWYSLSNIFTPIVVLVLYMFHLTTHPVDVSIIKSWWYWTFSALVLVGIWLMNTSAKKPKTPITN